MLRLFFLKKLYFKFPEYAANHWTVKGIIIAGFKWFGYGYDPNPDKSIFAKAPGSRVIIQKRPSEQARRPVFYPEGKAHMRMWSFNVWAINVEI